MEVECPSSNPAQNPSSGIVGLTLAPGDRVQHYTIVQQVGAGGTSAVFKAHDALLNRHVAVKQVLLAPGEEADAYRARALAEADAHKRAAAADPTMLVQLFDVVADPRGVLIITEFVDGPSLEQILQANPAPMEERQALGILAGAAKGLASLHGAGILHRDIKPSNILMPRAGGLRLADFGLSVAASTGAPMDQGTVRYMAPEVLQDQPATPASDLYALGLVAYEMMAGRAHFDEAFKAILRDQRNQPMRWLKWHTNPKIKAPSLAQLNPSLSAGTVELVERLMDKDPVRRIGSAGVLLGAIRTLVSVPAPATTGGTPPPWLAQQGPDIPQAPAAPTARVPRKARWPLVAAGAGTLVLLAALAAVALRDKKPDTAALEREHILALMNRGEDSWKAGDYAKALEVFQTMREGGAEARKEGTLSRRFADAGAAKCRAEIAFARKDYAGAVAAAEEFRKVAAALEADAKYPPADLHVTRVEESELAARMLDPTGRFQTRKDVADAIARMEAMLEEGHTKDCAGECNQWLSRPKLDPDERTRIKQILANCSKTRKELRIDRLLDDAGRMAADGDVQGAARLLGDEIKIEGAAADPRLQDKLDAILGKARESQLVAKYRAAETTQDKINLLTAVLELDPDFPDKAKLPALRADLLYAEAVDARQGGDLGKTNTLIQQGLALAPGHAELLALKNAIASQAAQAKLVASADSLFDQGAFADAVEAYKAVLDKVEDQSAKDKAADRLKQCRGQIKIAEAARCIKSGDLVKADIALKAAQEYLPDNADIAAGFDRIKELREARDLQDDASRALARGDHAAAIPLWFKFVTYLKAHPAAGDLAAAEERLRQCRFENALVKLADAMSRREWSSARGFAGNAETYASTAEDKKRTKEAKERLESAIASDR